MISQNASYLLISPTFPPSLPPSLPNRLSTMQYSACSSCRFSRCILEAFEERWAS